MVFDLWGTLAYLIPGPDFGEEIARMIGLEKVGFHEIVKKHWFKSEMSPEEFAQLLIDETNSQTNIKELTYWIKNPLKRARLYDDVNSSLNRLSLNNRLYIVSDTSTVGRDIIDKLGIQEHFQQVILSCKNGITKAEGLYYKFFRDANLDLEDTIVIGDSPALDYDIPINLGARAVLIDRKRRLSGYQTIQSLEEIE